MSSGSNPLIPAPLPPVLLEFVHSFAWFYWGLIFSTILLGVTLLQTWIYSRNNTDGWMLRSVVVFVVLMDIATTFLTTAAGDFYFIRSFGDVEAWLSMPYSLSSETVITVFVTFTVQCFFTYQIYNVSSQNLFLVLPCAFFAIAAFGAGLAYSAEIFLDTAVSSQMQGGRLWYLIVVGGVLDVFADLMATFAMSWTLMKSKTGIKRTDSLIKSLLTYIVNRGVLVTVCQFLLAVLFATGPAHEEWIFFHLQLSKVYTNTMLAILNARGGLRQMGADNTGVSVNGWPLSATVEGSHSTKPVSLSAFPSSGVTVVSQEESYVDDNKPISFTSHAV